MPIGVDTTVYRPAPEKRPTACLRVLAMHREHSPERGTPTGFLQRVSLTAAADGAAAAGGSVTLTTIHVAKGLEWPVVFLTGMEDGLFPSLRERDGVDPETALEEERRLAYVAITRARDRLVLTWARVRRMWGEARAQEPSRFLEDVPRRPLRGRAE